MWDLNSEICSVLIFRIFPSRLNICFEQLDRGHLVRSIMLILETKAKKEKDKTYFKTLKLTL